MERLARGGLWFAPCLAALLLTAPLSAQEAPGSVDTEPPPRAAPSGPEAAPATAAPAAPAAPAVEAETDDEDDAETAGGETRMGSVHVVAFASDVPAAGAIIVLPDGSEIPTDSAGAASFMMPVGDHTLMLRWPPDAEPRPMAGVLVAQGKTTEVIATAGPDGDIALDIMAPEGATAESVVAVEEEIVKGTVTGRVVSEEEGTPVAGARIYVAGQPVEAITDADGRFEIEVPAGVHKLSILHTKYSTQTVPDVEVLEEERVNVDITLTPAAIELEDFVITAPYISGGVATVMAERRQSAAVSDAIGAEDIARMPASNAAQAAQRVVGATIVGGRFVYVRGLGERYTNALLNGAPLPSPEPDRATVPLDLFPAQILASLDISKTFTPDVPANFAGGSVRITTKSVPEQPLFAVSGSVGYNTASTFKRYWGPTEKGDYDFLAINDGSRAVPDGAPSDYKLRRNDRKPNDERVSLDEIREASDQFNTPLGVSKRTMWPNFSASMAAGDSWEFGKDIKLGVLASAVYRRNYRLRKGALNIFIPASNDLGVEPLVLYKNTEATDGVRWGAFTSSTLELGKQHKVSLVAMQSQLGDTTTNSLGGFNRYLQNDVSAIHKDFITRGLTNVQLQGDHTFEALNEANLKWLGSLAYAYRQEDDTRDAAWFLTRPAGATDASDGIWTFYPDPASGRHFFSEQNEDAMVGGLDWLQPIFETDDIELKAKTGTLMSFKDRAFSARSFRYDLAPRSDRSLLGCGTRFDIQRCPADLFTDDNIGELLIIDEATGDRDRYEARLDVKAGYLMADLAVFESWRLVGGARVEETYQEVTAIDQFTGEPLEGDNTYALLSQVDILPAAALMYSPIEDGAIRLSVSQTLARPQLRELAPFPYINYFGGYLTQGEPELELTKIVNGDLRFEYFPTPSEVLAVSFFAKDFTNPIEATFTPLTESSLLTYENAKGALLYGAEFEVRKNLGFLGDAYEDFGVITSVMVAQSEIRVRQSGREDRGQLTNLNRPMVNAAPFVINAAIDYENAHGTLARILYNVTGKTLVAVGQEGLQDSYQQPRHVVDLSASQNLGEHFKLRLTVTNLLDAPFVVTEGRDHKKRYAEALGRVSDNVREEYREGTSVSIGLGYVH